MSQNFASQLILAKVILIIVGHIKQLRTFNVQNAYLRYGPNIWTNFNSLQTLFPPAECEPKICTTINSGKSDENATIISAMNKCSKKKYILVNFPPLVFLLSNAKIPQKLLKIVNAIKTLIMTIFAFGCSSLMLTKCQKFLFLSTSPLFTI